MSGKILNIYMENRKVEKIQFVHVFKKKIRFELLLVHTVADTKHGDQSLKALFIVTRNCSCQLLSKRTDIEFNLSSRDNHCNDVDACPLCVGRSM